MITKIKSRRIELPPIYLIEDENDFKQLPKGLPYIIGKQSELIFITVFLEYQTLLKSCLRTGLPIKWLDSLKRLGYNATKIRPYALSSGGSFWESSQASGTTLDIDDFIEQQYLVNFDKLAELKILPKWLDDIKDSIQTNIIDEVCFDVTAFNKQLGLNVGAGSIKHNMKNLLILDVSSSIPTSVVVSITSLAKLMSKRFYADIILTSSQSKLIDYDDVLNTDIVKLSESWSRGNEGEMYWEILKAEKSYNTCICFGDNDNPMQSQKENKCNFKIETLYSLHTDKTCNNITGYARPFEPKTVHKVTDWVSTLGN